MNPMEVRAKALRWYISERRDDPRIPDPYTEEGQSRLKVLCVYQASLEPDFGDDSFGSKMQKMLDDLRPLGGGRDWNLVHGWHNPEDIRQNEAPLWSPYWESVYQDIRADLTRLKREGFEDRAKRVKAVLSAIEDAFPEMVSHLKAKAAMRRM